MRYVAYELLLEAVKERGVDEIYEKLERLLYEEPLIIVNMDGDVVFRPFEPIELYEFLEIIKEKEVLP
jgi:hypothetical protein